MGIVSRISYAVRSKLNALVRSTEDPTETLDYSYERLRDQLQDVETGLADLTAQKKRLEVQQERLAQNVEKHDDQAWEAVKQGRDDLARRALEKKQAKRDQVAELDDQIADLERTQRDLEEQKDELEAKVEEFRTKKETMKARHEAAEAQTRVSETVTGVGDDDVARAIERAKTQTEEMEARAAAMDELSDRGVLDGAVSDDDRIDRELAAERDDVDAELAEIQSEVRGEDAAEPVDVAVEGETPDFEHDVDEAEHADAIDDADEAELSEAIEDVDEDAVEEELEAIREQERT
ncbi:PspA/IM30 family protein [Halobacterium bonnevillei]|uniref:PspA/IM30 family protein n=1 Tax=Halobacterium bonnevillei TaxID=2692200 RepID=A0A6B0SSV0_9EURY|nr:PspA/IM30 family protein [Halobacterium bonnevillei]MXR21880.1 PspA/IM30 family protein [Halobacterium bonnevillei]